MCVYIKINVYTYISIYIHIYIHIYIYIYIYVYICIYIYVYLYIYMHIHIYIYICIHKCKLYSIFKERNIEIWANSLQFYEHKIPISCLYISMYRYIHRNNVQEFNLVYKGTGGQAQQECNHPIKFLLRGIWSFCMYECRIPLSIYQVYLSSQNEVHMNFASHSIPVELALWAWRNLIILYIWSLCNEHRNSI